MLVMIIVAAGLQLGLATVEPVRRTGPSHTIDALGSGLAECEPGVATPELATRRTAGVRSGRKWVNGLIHDALRRSPTFARLARTIEAYRTIVYVEPRDLIGPRLVGAVPALIVHAPDGTRFARVLVSQGRSPDEMVETIGHELQHVVELLDAEAQGSTFGRSSRVSRERERTTGLWMIETAAARRVAQVIHRELWRDVCRVQGRRRSR